jgi:two-component system, OmpR family, response regulator
MKKVLIIDDTKNIRLMLATCLELRGYEVFSAENGQQALDIVKKERNNIQLIFLDIRMPGMSGTEVLKYIRSMDLNCPIIVMTAFATIKNAVDCTKLGAAAYLQKPFSTDRVNALLDEIELACNSIVSSEKEDSSDNIYISKAKELLDKCELDEAFSNIKLALSINPYEKEIYYLISILNEKINNPKEAKRFYSIYKLFDE